MVQEITTAANAGKTDEQILESLASHYGKNILLTPTFHGFDTLLWIVPVAVVVVGIGGTFLIQRRRISTTKSPK
jgi:cytochrome c-type biogenesis protein CcmH/NrfF